MAFCLAQGLAQTREAATARREAFEEWLLDELDEPDGEDLIDPQLFQQWQLTLTRPDALPPAPPVFRAELTGTDGRHRRYAVIPVKRGDETRWLDPAGFELAVSSDEGPDGGNIFRSDFELRTSGRSAGVSRVFRPA